MINQLLDEPLELNDQALRVMNAFFDGKSSFDFTVYDYKDINLNLKRVDLIKDAASLKSDEIERAFKNIFNQYLIAFDRDHQEIFINFPHILLSYRTKRDLSELVVFSFSLNIIFHEEAGKWVDRGYSAGTYNTWAEFVKDFCPQAYTFHRKISGWES